MCVIYCSSGLSNFAGFLRPIVHNLIEFALEVFLVGKELFDLILGVDKLRPKTGDVVVLLFHRFDVFFFLKFDEPVAFGFVEKFLLRDPTLDVDHVLFVEVSSVNVDSARTVEPDRMCRAFGDRDSLSCADTQLIANACRDDELAAGDKERFGMSVSVRLDVGGILVDGVRKCDRQVASLDESTNGFADTVVQHDSWKRACARHNSLKTKEGVSQRRTYETVSVRRTVGSLCNSKTFQCSRPE